jgi:omega-6 fatty acid desaturase (delta-12 desaturase)
VGGYLFYAQHNFPDAFIQDDGKWDFTTAAIRSSSYLKMGRVMAWFTGNIGYHHVHHLNHHIPFYRLPEALRSMPELAGSGVTTLWPMDVWRCLRLKVWDESRALLTGYPAIAAPANNARTTPSGPSKAAATSA